jgi:hypothetical protein
VRVWETRKLRNEIRGIPELPKDVISTTFLCKMFSQTSSSS